MLKASHSRQSGDMWGGRRGFARSPFIVALPASADVAEDACLSADRNAHYKARAGNVRLEPAWQRGRAPFACFPPTSSESRRFGVSCEPLSISSIGVASSEG